MATSILRPYRQNNTETLEIDNNEEDQDSCKQVGDVWKVLPIKCLSKGTNFVGPGNKKVEQGNDSTFKLSSTSSIDGGWAKCLPDDVLTVNQNNE